MVRSSCQTSVSRGCNIVTQLYQLAIIIGGKGLYLRFLMHEVVKTIEGPEQTLQSSAYRNFLIHIRNPLTKAPYVSRLKRYLQYCQTDNYDDLLYDGNIKQIQARIEDFLIHIQNPDYHIRPGTVGYYLVSIRFFYTMNDIVLNWKKIAKVLPAPRKATEDRPYTRDEIARLLEKADQRGRVVILLNVF